MTAFSNKVEDIMASSTRRGLPRKLQPPVSDTASYMRGVDNFCRVMAIRPGDHVVMLTDPLLDPRVVQAVQGLARGRGATFISYMGESTRYVTVPEEAKVLLERATFVVSTWFASVLDPYCIGLRRKKGQRWVKITFFRDLDLLHTPQAQFPVDLLGEIIRATGRMFPEAGDFTLQITDPRGTDFRVPFTEKMLQHLRRHNRWRGHNVADEDGCYVHYLPTHGPNLFEPSMVGLQPDEKIGINGIIWPQWAVGFDEPFKEPLGVEFRNDVVHAVHGESWEAQVMRDYLIGGTLEEVGCGHNPKAPRFDIYPAGPNSPGALHFGINALKPSEYLRRVMPNWEEPHIHMDLVTYDSTVMAGNRTLVEDGYLMSLRDPAVRSMAETYGDPVELLEAYPV
ncbi:hypothetical protein [Roseomonas xinghualingensis]|uniref:hypothetical protein n=1 Tax=Roseomonas xinghualingensis TaxID=2986475 RepID=UPI0021F1B9F6|nr:hypothetical protein [Roseomonas sp. SXEYE001]MCV4209105.1 hypothetical protein [Roseomonas sp. SXEYE001]